MDHSVTKCNLQTEMSSIKSPQKLLTKDTSSNQNLTDVDNSDEDSDIGLPINSNPNKLLSDLRVNLRIAMLKQAKILNQSFKTVSSNKVIVNNKSDLNKMTPQIKQAFSIKSKHLQSNLTKVIKNPNGKNTSIDIEMTDLDDLEKQNSDILKIAKNDTLKTDKLHSVILTEVRSPVKKQLLPANSNDEKVYVVSETQFKRNVKIVSPTAATSVLNQTLFVRKPLNLTTIMNVVESDVNKLPKLVSVRSLERSVRSEVFPFIIPKPKTSTEQDTNKVNVNSLLNPKSHQQKQTDKVNSSLVEQPMQHAFPKSITVKSIPLSRADREKIQYKPFRANIGGRFVTLRRMKTNDTGTSDSSSSTKQQTTKMSVRKASDGTYRVTSNSDINTNVLTIKKFKSNNHNSELKKVEALSFVSSDEDNQPSTSSAAFKRKPATSTLSSLVVPKEMSDEEQFVMSSETMPIKQSQPDLQQKTIVNEKEKRISTMLMRNTCFVHTPREPAKHENRLFKSRLQNGIIIRKNTSLLPDHTSYTIPQSLLTSSNVVRKVSASSNEGISNQSVSPQTTSPPNGEDLFMIQEDSNRNQGNVHMNKPGSSRRKSCLEPMDTFDEDTPFEKIREPPNIPPRPRQNIQLIESLARYRTIVRFMLNHLEIHQIDFNNDDYINLYKFYRG